MKFFIALILVLYTQMSFAIDGGKPLENALEAYEAKGVDSFIPTLLKGSPLEGEKSVLTQSNSIRQIEDYYGSYQDYEVIYEKKLTERVRLVYYVMHYENSPLFGVITYYKKKGGEVVSNFNVHTKLWEIMPKNVVFQ